MVPVVAMRQVSKGKRTQVKVWAVSESERDRWVAEAKRRKWSLTTLVREAVNRELEREQEGKVA